MSKHHEEKLRIDRLLAEGRITDEDHRSLLNALSNETGFGQLLVTYLFSPFAKVSGLKALLCGVVFICGLAILGSQKTLFYPGLFDFKFGNSSLGLGILLLQNIINVVGCAAVFYLGSRIARAKNLRAVDFLGTIAYARLPYFICAILIVFTNPEVQNPDLQNLAHMMVIGIIGILFLIWQIVLLHAAFKEASGLQSRRLWAVFVPGLLLAEVATFSLNILLKTFPVS
jgi:hypothetical protein